LQAPIVGQASAARKILFFDSGQAMKNVQLQKLKGSGIQSRMKGESTPGRYGKDAALATRRERREANQAMGLVPFAVKLNSDLIAKVHALQKELGTELNEVVAQLLEAGLAQAKK